jgi:type II secretory pathway pseudopilin PulG
MRSIHDLRRRRRSGLTLLELAMSIAVMVVGVSALASTVVTGSALNQVSHETEIARKAIETKIDAMRNTPFAQVFATYDGVGGDDPAGPNTAPGRTFAVAGLTPLAGAPGGVAGLITFPSTGPQLFENAVDTVVGMPRDLNLDGVVDAVDHAGDYMILPVRVRVQWMGAAGPRTIELQTQLSGL